MKFRQGANPTRNGKNCVGHTPYFKQSTIKTPQSLEKSKIKVNLCSQNLLISQLDGVKMSAHLALFGPQYHREATPMNLVLLSL